MAFSAVEAASGNHITFSVLDMHSPGAPWTAAAANPADPLHPTALRLQQEWRSNADKFNLGDARDAYDRTFAGGYITANGAAQSRLVLVHG